MLKCFIPNVARVPLLESNDNHDENGRFASGEGGSSGDKTKAKGSKLKAAKEANKVANQATIAAHDETTHITASNAHKAAAEAYDKAGNTEMRQKHADASWSHEQKASPDGTLNDNNYDRHTPVKREWITPSKFKGA